MHFVAALITLIFLRWGEMKQQGNFSKVKYRKMCPVEKFSVSDFEKSLKFHHIQILNFMRRI